MLENNRKRSIVFIGWGLIIGNSLGLLQPFFNTPGLIHNLFKVFHSSLQLVCVISTLIIIGFIIASVQLVKLREFGRSLVVFMALIDIPHLIVGGVIYKNRNIGPLYMRNASLIVLSIVLDVLLIYFLHRPRVRKQFHKG